MSGENMATESLIYEVNEKGARVVRRRIEDIGTGAERAGRGVDRLKDTLKNLASAATLALIGRYANTFVELQNRLRVVTKDSLELASVTDKLFKISQRTRSSFDGSVELYSRLAQSTKELGVNQEELLGFTERLNKAVILSGASAQEAQAGIIQLSQGLASGALRGDELRSVLEQLPVVADIIANQLGVTRGQLRELGKDGAITAQVVLEAFKNTGATIDSAFDGTVTTIPQALTKLRNAAIKAFGEIDKGLGLTQSLSEFIVLLADNFDVLGRAAIAAGLAISGVFVKKGIVVAIAAVKSLGVAIRANPLGFIATAAFSVVSVLASFSDKIKVTSDGLTTLANVGVVVFDRIRSALSSASSFFASSLSKLSNGLKTVFDGITFESASLSVAKFFDGIIAAGDAAWIVLKNGFLNIGPVIVDAIFSTMNAVGKVIENTINGIISLLNKLPNIEIGFVEFRGLNNPAKNAIKDVGKAAADQFNASFEAGIAQGFVKSVFEDARSLAQKNKPVTQNSNLSFGGSNSSGTGTLPITSSNDDNIKDNVVFFETSVQRLARLQKEVFESIKLPTRDFNELARTIKELQSLGKISEDEKTLFLADNNLVNDKVLGLQLYKAEYERSLNEIDVLRQNDVINEQQASRARALANAQYLEQKLKGVTTITGAIATLSNSSNKKVAEKARKVALFDATVRGFQAAQRAYAEQGIPGLIASAIITANNINSIRSQPTGFMTGGSFTVGGQGGADSQVVPIRATPGERVTVSTPEQVRRGGGATGEGGSNVTLMVANFSTMEAAEEWLDSGEADKKLLNRLEANSAQVKQIASNG